MSVAVILLQLYLASVLGISGLAKAADLRHFEMTLRRQRIVPPAAVVTVARLIPLSELALACVLVSGIGPLAAALLTVAFLAVLLLFKVVMLLLKRTADCGCYGSAYRQTVDGASAAVSAVQTAVASLNVWAVMRGNPVGAGWRVAGIAVFCVAAVWLIAGMARSIPRRRAGQSPTA